ncbi:hypothetical protein SAMN05660841_02038 [Sphingobacterium nematocida]|uniref:6-bladed beta-propeller protein n=1 Tax=Sphingobacterium nematocida TaxID=1513896 RepID=A0A1T5DKC2_9SPHI|nr:6-bladed beta-propeller [Sphingobacterium nematocida]SKB72159.1 hypothetical protein SAMN05660841_02038 [Sphingobacterium nematocida]
MRIYLLFTLVLSFFLCQGQRLIYPPQIPTEKIRIILEQTKGGTVADRISDLQYIPLKGDKTNLIDNIGNIAILEDRIAILSSISGALFLYNKDGTFIKKITKIEGHKSRYGNTLFYEIKVKDGNFVASHGEFEVTIGKEGNILDTLSKQYEENNDVSERLQLDDKELSFTNPYYRNTKKDNRAISAGDNIWIRYDSKDTIRSYYSLGYAFSKINNSEAYCTLPNNTKIFKLNAAGIEKVYDIIFPFNNTMDSSAGQIYKDYETYEKYIKANPQKVYGLGNVVPHHRYLIFLAGRYHDPRWIAYDLESKEAWGLDYIIPDKSNDYLSFFDTNNIITDGEYLYSYIYPQQVRSAKNKSMDERHSIRKEYADLEKYNNPVLVRFKIK